MKRTPLSFDQPLGLELGAAVSIGRLRRVGFSVMTWSAASPACALTDDINTKRSTRAARGLRQLAHGIAR